MAAVQPLPKKGKNNCMVTTKGDDPWMMFAIGGNGNERFARQRIITKRGERGPVEELLVAVFDLLDSKPVVIGCDGDITTVDDLETGEERVDIEGNVVAAIQSQTTGSCTNTGRTKAGTRAI